MKFICQSPSFPWFSMGFPWFSMGFPWVSILVSILFRAKFHDFPRLFHAVRANELAFDMEPCILGKPIGFGPAKIGCSWKYSQMGGSINGDTTKWMVYNIL
jgi:hypothetical protein